MDIPDREFPPTDPEVCFQIPESGELRLDLANNGPATLNYLKYRVIRDPADLLSHMRRIILVGRMSDSDNLYAALIDLFIALGPKGESLRSRMLKQYRPALSSAQYATLLQYFKQGDVGEPNPASSASVLAKGIIGACSFIRPINGTAGKEKRDDPLHEARRYLEYSQIDAAREVLERAVLENPERIDVQIELLELYRAGRDIENYEKTFNRLRLSGNRMSKRWSAVSGFLAENA